MALDNYAALKLEIADYLARDDLAANIDTFIDLAEARHKTDVRIREQVTRATANMTGRYTAFPSGFLQMQTLRLLTDPLTVLTEVNDHEMNRRYQTAPGLPKFFNTHEAIELDRVPDATYVAEMKYWKSVTPLDDDNPVNAVLTRSPGLYLYGALTASAPFLQDDQRVQLWNGMYTEILDNLTRADILSRHGSHLVSQPAGATP